jgi:hypothetical protein
MSASDTNNRNGTNNMEQKESEVEAAVGRPDVRGGDNPREGGFPATGTRDLETAQSEGDIVATQLDGLAREQEENEGSSMEENGPLSEGSGSLPGMHGIFLKQSARELEMVTAVKGGVQQGRKPSWSFTGKLSLPYGNKRGSNDPATVADKSTEVALMCGYHTTVTPWIVGDKEAREILGLTKEDSEQVLVLGDSILRHCYRELDTIGDCEWQNQMSCALKWQEHASRMRLMQSTREADIQVETKPSAAR